MRMDDAGSIRRLDVASQSQSDFEASTRILFQLTSGGIEPATPWQTDDSSQGGCASLD